MPVAFTMIEAEVGKIDEILHQILKINEVTEAYSVTGPYAIVAKIEHEKFEKLTEIIPEKIHNIKGVIDTLTMIAFGVSKEHREKACEEAKKLAKENKTEELYNLCTSCEQAKFCAYGARVITYGF